MQLAVCKKIKDKPQLKPSTERVMSNLRIENGQQRKRNK